MDIYYKDQVLSQVRKLIKSKLPDDQIDFITVTPLEFFCLRRDLDYPEIYTSTISGMGYIQYGDITIFCLQ